MNIKIDVNLKELRNFIKWCIFLIVVLKMYI